MDRETSDAAGDPICRSQTGDVREMAMASIGKIAQQMNWIAHPQISFGAPRIHAIDAIVIGWHDRNDG